MTLCTHLLVDLSSLLMWCYGIFIFAHSNWSAHSSSPILQESCPAIGLPGLNMFHVCSTMLRLVTVWGATHHGYHGNTWIVSWFGLTSSPRWNQTLQHQYRMALQPYPTCICTLQKSWDHLWYPSCSFYLMQWYLKSPPIHRKIWPYKPCSVL